MHHENRGKYSVPVFFVYFHYAQTRYMPLLILIAIFVLIAIWMTNLYNALVRLRNQRQNTFADIDVLLRQRHDLVFQLVETVKGYAAHERELLTKITETRSAAIGARSIDERIQTEQRLSSVLRQLQVQVEAYPDLKANQNFHSLQENLNNIESNLASSRSIFNNVTAEYNTATETFPSNLIARNFGFQREIFFDLGSETRKQMEEPPKISFTNN